MNRSYNIYSEKLVQRVNELYHDFINEEYHYTHPDIFLHETKRWKRIFLKFLKMNTSLTILDIGTGTGFVPLTLAQFLKKSDTFICSDISKGILDIAKKKLREQKYQCDFKFIKIEKNIPFKLSFESNSIDIITINSVLHHIKDTNFFLNEINRILKKNGLVFIGHEVNHYFYNSRVLKITNFIMNNAYPPLKIFYNRRALLRKISYFIFSKKKKKKSTSKYLTKKIYEVLIEENLIQDFLVYRDIKKIVNIKSREGFKPDSLFPHYKLLYLEIYNHLGKTSALYNNKLFIKNLNNLLERLYPKKGKTFFLVVKKI